MKALIFISLCVSCSGNSAAKKGSIQRYRLELIMQNAEGSPIHQGVLAFVQKLRELSKGDLIVDIILIDELNSTQELIEPVIKGEANIVLVSSAYADLSYKIPELEIIGQAYLFRDYKHYLMFRETEYAKSLREAIAQAGLIGSTAWYFGVRHTTSNNPIYSLDNFKGLRLRVPPVDSSIAFAESMGAIALPITFSGLYDAVESKFVDAQENSLSTIESTKLYKVQKHIAITEHSISLAIPMINKNIYDSFSAEQEAWYNEAIDYGRQVCYNLTIQQENYLLEKFEKEYSMIISYPNINELRSAMKPHYDTLEERYGKGKVYNIINIK